MTAHPDASWARCSVCGAGFYPRQRHCTACSAWDAAADEPLPRRGRLFTFTVIHVAPSPSPLPVPYALGYVDLDEGPRVLAPIALRGDPERELCSGTPLVLIAHDAADHLPFHCEVVA